MTTTEKIKIVSELVSHYKKITAVFDALHKITSCSPESKIHNAVWGGFDSYTKAVSKIIGDEFEYVSWYIWDNKCGDHKGAVTWQNGAMKVVVVTVKDLIKVIESND